MGCAPPQSSGLMSTAPSLLFLALCVDTLVKLLLLVRYEELHRPRSEIHISTGSVLHLCIRRKLAQRETTKDRHSRNSTYLGEDIIVALN